MSICGLDEPVGEYGNSLILVLSHESVTCQLVAVLEVVGHSRVLALLNCFEAIVPPCHEGRSVHRSRIGILFREPFPGRREVIAWERERVSEGAEVPIRRVDI